MTAIQNNFLGPAALIFSSCFPAIDGWETGNAEFGAAHELLRAEFPLTNANETAGSAMFQSARRHGALLFGGTTLRIY
jgi:hypothetical protein